jgi:hypothetical protein
MSAITTPSSNGITVNEDLTTNGSLLGPINEIWNYSNPKEVFNSWLGINNNIVTQTNNYIPAPGVVYKKTLHDQIGLPDLDNFRAIADFEYWVRVLYFEKKISYLPFPTWLYRLSKYSVNNEVIDGKINGKDLVPYYHEKLKEKYQKLINNG